MTRKQFRGLNKSGRLQFRGLNKSGRVDWDMSINLKCAYYADNGLHARTIAEILGLSIAQVHYRCGLMGRRLRDYRDGNTVSARLIIKNANVRTTSERDELKKYVTLRKK